MPANPIEEALRTGLRVLAQVGAAAAEAAVESVLDDVERASSGVTRRVRKAKSRLTRRAKQQAAEQRRDRDEHD